MTNSLTTDLKRSCSQSWRLALPKSRRLSKLRMLENNSSFPVFIVEKVTPCMCKKQTDSSLSDAMQ